MGDLYLADLRRSGIVLLSIFCMLSMAFLPVVQGWVEDMDEPTREDIIPGPYRDLSGLVDDLIADTVDHTDTDGDGLPDKVELIIGTDPEMEDTDGDKLNDSAEASLNTDPHRMDSNFDGIPDSVEIIGVNTDVDGDGISNAWDRDNDHDGLEDDTDLSPFFTTAKKNSFHFDLNTSGEDTYVSFQVRTKNPQNMNMMVGSYDWPYDDKAMMKDLDNSTDDMFINPLLKIRMSDVPDQEDVIDYGIMVDGNTCIIPMFPEREYGKIVALRGKMFIPEGEPTDLDLDLSFEWSVTGNSDQPVSSIRCSNDMYLTSMGTGTPRGNSSQVKDHQGFVIEELGNDMIAFKTMDGTYLGVDDSDRLTAEWGSLEENCKFRTAELNGLDIIGTASGLFLTLRDDGTIFAGEGDEEDSMFNISDAGIRTQMINLIRYREEFSIAGMQVSEKFGTDLSTLYGPDLEEMLMSGVVLSRDFLRNETNEIEDMIDVLATHNLTLDSISGHYEHTDLALLDSINRITGQALSQLPDGKVLPLITLVEDSSSNLDILDFTRTDGTTFGIDIGSEPAMRSRMMKLAWYNTPDTDPMSPGELIGEVASWNLNRETGTDTASLLLFWAVGDSTVMSVGDDITNWEVPEVNLDEYTIGMNIFNTAKWITGAPFAIIGGFKDILEIGAKIDILAKAGSTIGDGLKSIITTLKMVKIVDTAKDVLKFLDTIGPFLDILGLFIDYGIGVFNLIMIVCSNGWDAFAASVASAQFIISMAYSIVMFLIGLIPVVGTIVGIIMLIADLVDLVLTWIPGVSGYQDIIMNWILGIVAGARTFCDLDLVIVSTEMDMKDVDENGLDAGDRFELESLVNTSVVKTKWGSKIDVEEGYIKPYYRIYAPSRPEEAGLSGTRYSKSENYQEIVTETSTDTRKDTQWRIGGWVEPGFGMVNYPVYTGFGTDYRVFYEEYNYVAFWFPELWERKNITDSDYTRMETLYFDIMPESMDDLARWGYLKRSDRDGDGINNTDEPGTCPTNWDTDGDGLGDSYELDLGTNPMEADSDLDGLDDMIEERYGMNLNNNDTDGDGLYDYLELEGWIVQFDYEGTPFYWHIVSDPTLNDTDGDGINDLYEFYCNLNPLSKDTDGNGTFDMMSDYITYDIIQDEIIGDDESRKFARCNEFAVDSSGDFYIKGDVQDYLLKISSNGYYRWTKKIAPWGDTYNDEVISVHVGPNGTVYVGTYGWGGDIKVYLLDQNGNVKGTWDNDHVGEISTLFVDSDDNVYVMGIGPGEYPHMAKIDPNGTEMDYAQLPYYGSGTGRIGSNHGNSIAVNSHGDIYLIDRVNSRVHVYYPNLERNFTWQIPQFNDPGDIFIDYDDNIYIIDNDQTYGRIQAFDVNRRLLSEWSTSLSETSIFVGSDGKIYVGGNTDSGTYRGRIISFDMKTTLHRVDEDLVAEDTDEDGLSDEMEWEGWTCNATTPEGPISDIVFSSPKLFDTDGDGLNDSYEMDLMTNPNSTDTDRDGLDDLLEMELGTNPLHFDTDRDDLTDSMEVAWGSDPLDPDADGEGLKDHWEFLLRTNPWDPDTDDDGLTDLQEKEMGYDPLDPDPDHDSLFDGYEHDLGSGPYSPDNDGDGIEDGKEIVYNTDPTSGDSDGDLLPDGYEIEMKLNPVSNDTDGDGMLDSTELEVGYNPFSMDSDGDGTPDGSDLDFTIDIENITFVSDGSSGSEKLGKELLSHCQDGFNIVPASEANMSNDPYIVILGKPGGEDGSSGHLVDEILSDSPQIKEDLNSSLENRFVVRYGLWRSEQTVIILSEPMPNDHNRILGMIRSVRMTVSEGMVISEQMTPVTFVSLDSFDITRTVGAAFFCEFEGNETPTVELSSSEEGPVPMNGSTGVGMDLVPMKRFIGFEIEGPSMISDSQLRIYYSLDDLDINGDGDAEDEGDIDESTIILMRLENGTWMELSTMYSVNTTDVTVNGIRYAGSIMAWPDHYSDFGLVGMGFEVGEYELIIGPVLDDEGVVVEGALVRMVTDYLDISMETDVDGMVNFNLSRTVFDVPVSIYIEKEDHYPITLDTNITASGTLGDELPPLIKIPPVIENITRYFHLEIGPVIDEEGEIIENCQVTISIGNLTLDSNTDSDGMVSFNLSEDLFGSDIDISLSAEGYNETDTSTVITMEGTLEGDLPALGRVYVEPKEEEKDEKDKTVLFLVIGAIVLMLIIAFVIFRKKEKTSFTEE